MPPHRGGKIFNSSFAPQCLAACSLSQNADREPVLLSVLFGQLSKLSVQLRHGCQWPRGLHSLAQNVIPGHPSGFLEIKHLSSDACSVDRYVAPAGTTFLGVGGDIRCLCFTDVR
jgi:hypothetical protein